MNTITDGVVSVDVPIIDGYDGSREARTLAHTLMSGAVSYTLREAAPEVGTLRCVLEDEADALDLYDLACQAITLTLTATDRPAVSMEFVVFGGAPRRTLDDGTRDVWIVEIPFQVIP